MNTYKKYCPNVFVAQCDEAQVSGEVITLETKYGKEHENEVHNFLGKTREGKFLYSISRVDGFDHQERMKRKAEKLRGYEANAENRSTQHYQDSHEGRDFLSLGEPIKIGHHSERRHRALIERNWQRMGKSVAETEKAKDYASRAEYWEARVNTVNLSMVQSLPFFEFKLEQAKIHHKDLKDNPEKRRHSMALAYASKAVKDTEKNLNLAVKLWGTQEEIEQIDIEKKQEAEAKTKKSKRKTDLLLKYGAFYAFNTAQFKAEYQKAIDAGTIEEGETVMGMSGGLNVPLKHHEEFTLQF